MLPQCFLIAATSHFAIISGQQKFLKIAKKGLLFLQRRYIIHDVDRQENQNKTVGIDNGPSPNGKATDSDSVISRFESLWASLKPQWVSAEVFVIMKIVERNERMKKKKATQHFIPLILLLTIVPLIVFLYTFQHSGLAQFDWHPENDSGQDFFMYYKALAIVSISAAMCVILAFRYKTNKKEFKLCYEFIPLLVYAVFTILSSLFSPYRYFSFHGMHEMYESLWVLLSYVVITFYAYQLINTMDDVDRVMNWLTVGLGAMLIIGILQAVGHDFFNTDLGKMLITGTTKNLDQIAPVFEKGRVFLTVYNPNYVASYFSLMIPVEIALLIKSKKWPYRILYMIMLAASIVCLLASGNRSGVVAFAVTIVMTLLLLHKHILKAWKIVLPAVVVVVAIIVAFISRNDYIIQKFQRLLSAGAAVDDPISKIVTGDSDVAITYKGEVFHVSYEIDENNNIPVYFFDDDNQTIDTSLDTTTYIYTVEDARFAGFTIQVVKLGENIALDVKIDDFDWYFLKGEDGTYYYYNIFGRMDKVNNAPRVAVKFLEKVFEERGTIWSKTIPLLKNSLLFGSGADTFAAVYPQDDYVDKTYDNSRTGVDVKPHCLYLQIAVQSGIPAAIAVIVFYIWYFITSFRLYYKAAYQDGLEIVGVGLMLATFTYMVISFLNDSTVTVAPIYWIMMGMGIAINEILRKRAASQPLAIKTDKSKAIGQSPAVKPDKNKAVSQSPAVKPGKNKAVSQSPAVKPGKNKAVGQSLAVKPGKKAEKAADEKAAPQNNEQQSDKQQSDKQQSSLTQNGKQQSNLPQNDMPQNVKPQSGKTQSNKPQQAAQTVGKSQKGNKNRKKQTQDARRKAGKR